MRRILDMSGWLAVGLIWLVKVGLLGLAVVWLLVHTPWGFNEIERRINQALDREASGGVRVTGLGGLLPFMITVDSVHLDDAEGTWLVLQTARADVSLRAMLMGSLGLQSFHATGVTMSRRPVSSEQPEASVEPGFGVAFPSAFIRELRVGEVEVGPEVAGGKTVTGQIEGSLESDRQHGVAAELILVGVRMDDHQGQGRIRGRLQTDGGGAFQMTLVVDKDEVDAWAELAPEFQLHEVGARFAIQDVARYRDLHDQEGSGGVSGVIRLAWQQGGRRLAGAVQGHGLAWHDLEVSEVDLEGAIGEPWGEGEVTVKGQARGVSMGAITATVVRVEGSADQQQGKVFVFTEVVTPAPGSLDLSGDLTWDSSGVALDGLNLQLHGDGIILGTEEPLSVSWRDRRLSIPTWKGRLNDSPIRGHLDLQPGESVDLGLAADSLPLGLLALVGETNVQGRVRMTASLSGDWTSPKGDLALVADHLEIHPFVDHRLAPTSAVLSVHWQGTVADVHLVAMGRQLDPVVVHGGIPLVQPAGPWPRLDRDGQLALELSAAQSLPDWVPVDGQGRYEGRGTLGAILYTEGSLASPKVRGEVTLRHGGLRDTFTGIRLQPIELLVVSSGRTARIVHATATDAQGGTVSASGEVDWAEGELPSGWLSIQLKKLVVIQAVYGALPVSGEATLEGEGSSWKLSGELAVERTHLAIPRVIPPSIADLEVVDLHAPPHLVRSQDQPQTSRVGSDLEIPLDLVVRTASEVAVTGRGLTSEWAGQLNLGGTAREPVLAGGAHMTRGTLFLMGRRFSITEAELLFSGASPPDPHLNIRAQTSAAGLLILLDVIGSMTSPRLVLRSVPDMPQNDILSYLLFGKSSDRISPLQAVTLAHNLNILAGGGSALGILERGQSQLGVDQIELVLSDEANEVAAVTVGKYLGQRLYLEGRRSLGDGDDEVAVEIMLTPNFSLRTEATPGIREGIGIYWRREF